MKKTLLVIEAFSFAFLLFLSSCAKGPGEGGKATIFGKLIANSFSYSKTLGHFTYNATFPGQGESVYIVYGSDRTYGNSVKTNYDGTFEFPYLRPGKYTVYAYSKDTLKYLNGVPNQAGSVISNKTVEVIQEIEISGKKDEVQAQEIDIVK